MYKINPTIGIGLFITLALGVNVASGRQIQGKITKISDGDTVHFVPFSENNTDRTETLKIRMMGMDAPELHLPTPSGGSVAQMPWGQDATDHLISILPLNATVTLKEYGQDTYRRTLGKLFRGNRDVNLAMVENGWAVPYAICSGRECKPNFIEEQNLRDYRRACIEARENQLGIFHEEKPLNEMPFEFRLRNQRRQPDKWVGDIRNRKLFPPHQYTRVDLCDRIFFTSQAEAENLGFISEGGFSLLPGFF